MTCAPSRQAAPRPCAACPLEQAAPGVHTALPPVPSLHHATSSMRPSPFWAPFRCITAAQPQSLALAWGRQHRLPAREAPCPYAPAVGHLGYWCGPPCLHGTGTAYISQAGPPVRVRRPFSLGRHQSSGALDTETRSSKTLIYLHFFAPAKPGTALAAARQGHPSIALPRRCHHRCPMHGRGPASPPPAAAG